MLITTHKKHAYENFLTRNLNSIDGIIVVSGDGIINEIASALYQRDDYETIKEIPFGIIPAGTGNGLVKSLTVEAKELCNVTSAVFIICKGKTNLIDCMEVEFYGDTRKYISIHSIGLGLTALINYESDSCRCLGSSKFTLWAYYRWICSKHFPATVYIIDKDTVNENFSINDPLEERSIVDTITSNIIII